MPLARKAGVCRTIFVTCNACDIEGEDEQEMPDWEYETVMAAASPPVPVDNSRVLVMAVLVGEGMDDDDFVVTCVNPLAAQDSPFQPLQEFRRSGVQLFLDREHTDSEEYPDDLQCAAREIGSYLWSDVSVRMWRSVGQVLQAGQAQPAHAVIIVMGEDESDGE